MDPLTSHKHKELDGGQSPSLARASQCLGQLPLDALALREVLKCISLRERLTNCARVSKQFKEAAMAATTAIALKAVPDRCADMQQWLEKYKSQHNVTCMELLQDVSIPMSIRNPPFQGIRQLRLCEMHVQLGPVGDHPGMLAAAEQLQWLSLERCCLLGQHCLQALTALKTGVQHLRLEYNVQDCCSAVAWQEVPTAPLAQLLYLTHLTLAGSISARRRYHHKITTVSPVQLGPQDLLQYDTSTLAATTVLTRLQELKVQGLSLDSTAFRGFQQLQALTKLCIIKASAVPFGPTTTPALSTLTALQELHISHAQSLAAQVLTRMTQLHCLILNDTPLLGGAMGTGWLLQVLQQLQLLKHLEVKRVIQVPPPDLAAYTALHASSCLSHLSLHLADQGEHTAAQDWQHIFPRQQGLGTDTGSSAVQCRTHPPEQQQWRQQGALPSLQELDLQLFHSQSTCSSGSGWDLGALADCCPGLRHLTIACLGFFPPPVLVVHELTQLMRLNITAKRMQQTTAAAQVADVAHLTQLRSLQLAFEAVQLQQLMPLTALQALTELTVTGQGAGGADSNSLNLQACQEAAKPPSPPVHQQLLEVCEAKAKWPARP